MIYSVFCRTEMASMDYRWKDDTDDRYVSDAQSSPSLAPSWRFGQEPEVDRDATDHVSRGDALSWSFGLPKPRSKPPVVSPLEALSWRLSDNIESKEERGAEAGATASWTRQPERDSQWITHDNSVAHALSWPILEPQQMIDSGVAPIVPEPSAPPLHPGAPVTPSAPPVLESSDIRDVYPPPALGPLIPEDTYSPSVLEPTAAGEVYHPPYHGDRSETPPPTYQEAIESGLIEPPS